ncbi:MAG: glycosyltransferase family 4 protein, partial [Candidatus Njordarchaeales archaeon]
MKILMVNPTYGGISGTGQYIRELSTRLKRNDHEVEVMNLDVTGIMNISKIKSISFYILSKIKLPVYADKYDIIHIHNPKFAGLASTKTPTIITVHGDYMEFEMKYGRKITPLIRYIERKMRRAKIITTVSPLTAKLRKWIYTPNGIDLEWVRRIPAKGNGNYILWVGRNDSIKRPKLFKEAMKILNLPNLAIGVDIRVPRKEVIAYMKSGLCLVITSRWEGFPTTLLEAWASKIPVISVPIAPLKVLSRGAIYFSRSEKPEDIAEAVKEVISNEKLREE